MDIINVLDSESVAEYRRSVVRKAYSLYPHLSEIPVDEVVNNCMLFPAIWLDVESKTFDARIDFFTIFKPYGDKIYLEVNKEFWKRRHKLVSKKMFPGKKNINKKTVSNTFSPKLRWQVMERDGHKCVKCGRSAADGVKLHVDHIYPKSRGGMATLSNGQTLCNECNIGKGARVSASS